MKNIYKQYIDAPMQYILLANINWPQIKTGIILNVGNSSGNKLKINNAMTIILMLANK
jgi:hypothetical protein